MDPFFLVGLVVALLSIVISTIMDGNSFGPLIGPSSLLLVLMGAVGGALMAYRKEETSGVFKAAMVCINGPVPDINTTVNTLARLSEVARKEGMLALESKLEEVEDPFLKQGLQLLVDGMDADQVRDVLEIEIAALDERHQVGIGFWKGAGGYAPTFGMMGTVIGLINMLGNLSDPSQLGKGMSMALLTTLYGVLFSNLLFLPMATRLERLNGLEVAAMEIALDGILALQSGTSPRMLVERLETYLPEAERIGYQERLGQAAA